MTQLSQHRRQFAILSLGVLQRPATGFPSAFLMPAGADTATGVAAQPCSNKPLADRSRHAGSFQIPAALRVSTD